MPLVVLTGFPSSGKSKRAQEIVASLQNVVGMSTHLVTENEIVGDRNKVFAEPQKEKDMRASLKSFVQRKLTKDDIVVLDSGNYIKGYRYELFCLAKSMKTTHCVVHCDTSKEKCWAWNTSRADSEQYSEEILNALTMRYEEPDARNRWDSPLITVQAEDTLPLDLISEALLHGKSLKPNQSTQSQPLSSTNFLYELDKRTQEVVNIIIQAQKISVPGDDVTIPGTQDKIHLVRALNLAELSRLRRQFITYTKTHPVDDPAKLTSTFVKYLNNYV